MQRLQHKCEPHSTCHIQQFANQPKTQPRANSNARASGSAKVSLKLKRETKTKSKIAFCVVIPKIDATPKPETDIETAKISIKLVAVRQQSRDDACASLAKQDMARNDDRSWERGMQMQCLIDDTLCWCCWWTLSIVGIVRVRKNKRLKAQTRAASECNARTLLINHACVTRECRRATGEVC